MFSDSLARSKVLGDGDIIRTETAEDDDDEEDDTPQLNSTKIAHSEAVEALNRAKL